MPHIGIYLQNKSDFLSLADNIFSNLLLKDLVDLEGKRGEMFSKMTIDKFIDRELKMIILLSVLTTTILCIRCRAVSKGNLCYNI